jgi:hypothetical protein
MVFAACTALVGCQGGSATPNAKTPADRSTGALPPASAAAPTSTVALKDGGRAIIEADNKVTVIEPDGQEAGSSFCGNYDASVALLRRFQSAVRSRDVATVVALVRFPLHWSGKVVADEAAFRSQFDEIFSAGAVRAIEGPDPAGLFCNWHGFMMGDGVVWGGDQADGAYRVQTLNLP